MWLRLRDGVGRLGREPGGAETGEAFGVRSGLRLSVEQREAARITGRPSLVVGPAGSGKSVVLVQAVGNALAAAAVREGGGRSEARYLVTATNEPLVRQLAEWLGAGLGLEVEREGRRALGGAGSIYRVAHRGGVVELMAFDVLPGRCGFEEGAVETDLGWHREVMGAVLGRLGSGRGEAVRHPYGEAEYVLSELHRIVYAQGLVSETEYLEADRKGRGRETLKKGGPARRFLWAAMRGYLEALEEAGRHSAITWRAAFRDHLRRAEEGAGSAVRYGRVFVDEYQDFTPADMEILYALVEHPNGMCLAGDGAQAVYLGGSTRAPRQRDRADQAPFLWHRLTHSRRLPYGVARSLRPLSASLHRANEGAWELTPARTGPPGPRPLVVGGEDAEELAAEIAVLRRTYGIYGAGEAIALVFEGDEELARRCREEDGMGARAASLFEEKGMEHDFVIWSTEVPLPNRFDVLEQAYSILTRTRCLLVVTVTPGTGEEAWEVLRMLEPGSVRFWNARGRELAEGGGMMN